MKTYCDLSKNITGHEAKPGTFWYRAVLFITDGQGLISQPLIVEYQKDQTFAQIIMAQNQFDSGKLSYLGTAYTAATISEVYLYHDADTGLKSVPFAEMIAHKAEFTDDLWQVYTQFEPFLRAF